LENISQIAAIAIVSFALMAVLVVAQVLHKYLHIGAEHTRKFMHLAVGLICVFAPIKPLNPWHILASTVIFIGLLIYTKKKALLPSLHKIGRDSHGDILLSVVVFLNYLLVRHYDFETLFYLPLLVLSISDPAAFYGGFLFHKTKKSLHGSLFFVLSALLTCWLYLAVYSSAPYPHQFWLIVACAVTGAVVEYKSGGGWDNLTVPMAIGVVLVAYFEIKTNYGID
jgi:dolichol kinase